jgi:hypothetical protein
LDLFDPILFLLGLIAISFGDYVPKDPGDLFENPLVGLYTNPVVIDRLSICLEVDRDQVVVQVDQKDPVEGLGVVTGKEIKRNFKIHFDTSSPDQV